MCLRKDTLNKAFIFKNLVMENSKEQKILGVTVDDKLNCKSHIKALDLSKWFWEKNSF